MVEQSVTLQPGEAKVVTFEAIPREAKTYQVSVNGLSGSFRAITLGEVNILRITIHTSPPVVGKRVALSVSLTNQSGVTASYHLDIYVDGLRILSWNGTLLHRQGSNIGAVFTPTRAGIHTAKADLNYGREVLTKDFEVFLPPPPTRATLSLSGRGSKPEYKRGEQTLTILTIKNTGLVTATGVEDTIRIYDSNGAIWWPHTTWFPRPDIAPGGTSNRGFSSTLHDTDPLGQYTYKAWARADNADEVSDAGNTFVATE